mgnify:CR=1 FL=1
MARLRKERSVDLIEPYLGGGTAAKERSLTEPIPTYPQPIRQVKAAALDKLTAKRADPNYASRCPAATQQEEKEKYWQQQQQQ